MEKGLLNSFVYGYFTYLGGPNSGVFQRAMVIVKSLYELDDPSLIPRGMDLFCHANDGSKLWQEKD